VSGRTSAAVERAIKRVLAGETRYAAAKAEKIALSTIYRAMKRLRPRAA
jgi:transposase